MKECSVCQSCLPDGVAFCGDDGQPARSTLPIEIVLHGRYSLKKRLGHGSVSIVYSAVDIALARYSAVRIIPPALVGNDFEKRDRFLRDATATAAIQHANIVAVTDSGIINDVMPYIVMELVSGPSLQETLSSGSVLSPAAAVDFVSMVGSGLAAAHKLEIVHGDLKPRNILFDKNSEQVETLKISDFGLSNLKSSKLDGPLAVAKSTSMLRSPLYLAPEEWSDADSDSRADIYSLGVILYQMLAGHVPFDGKSIPAIMKQHLMDAPPPINKGRRRTVSKELEAVVLHALRKDRAERPATVEEFVEELRSVKGLGASSKVGAPASRVRNPVPRRVKKTPSVEKDPTPAGEFGGPLSGVDASQTLDLDVTLREYAAVNLETTLPVDMEQTIGIPTKQIRLAPTLPVESVASPTDDPLRIRKTMGLETSEPDMDMTIVPGMPGFPSSNNLTEFVDGPVPIRVSQQEVSDTNEDVNLMTSTIPAKYDSNPYSDELPRSIPPALLAAGVFLVILLIAIGVYYANATE